jgi:hypothetical protein
MEVFSIVARFACRAFFFAASLLISSSSRLSSSLSYSSIPSFPSNRPDLLLGSANIPSSRDYNRDLLFLVPRLNIQNYGAGYQTVKHTENATLAIVDSTEWYDNLLIVSAIPRVQVASGNKHGPLFHDDSRKFER